MNKVVVIGGSGYHNSLGLARSFGINGISAYGILIGDKNNKWNNPCALSKYWKKTWIVDDEEEALILLEREFNHEKEKPVLVPSSDGAALVIDQHYNRLSQRYFIPGIKNQQGTISKLMNKYDQVQWARSLGLDIANAEVININAISNIHTSLRFPIILKPVLSAEGKKQDIRKCVDEDSFIEELTVLKKKGYQRILAQEYVNKDYEMELWGAVVQNSEKNPYLLSKHAREWPSVGGTVCYHEFITEPKMKKQAEDILNKIKACGYVGNIDIELFMVDGKLMLNEVNFRNSGDIYASFTNRVYYPYYQYLDMLGMDISDFNMSYNNESTAMDENLDVRHFIFGNLSFISWLKDWKRCKDFSWYFKGDLKPAIARYFSVLFMLRSKFKSEKSRAKEK